MTFGLVAWIGLAEAQSQSGVPPLGGLRAWFKADAGVTVAGDQVIQWLDQSPNGYTLAPAGNGPILGRESLNGSPALSFDGQVQLNGDLGAEPLSTASVFALFRYTIESSDNDYLYTLGTDGDSGSQLAFSRRDEGQIYHFDGQVQNIAEEDVLEVNEWHVSSQLFGTEDGRRHTLFLDGTLQLQSDADEPYSADPSSAVIGNWSSGSYGFVGDLVELLIYDRVLSGDERSSVEAYLERRSDPESAVPGAFVVRSAEGDTVFLNATPPAGALAYAVEETVPLGVVVSRITEGGVFDVGQRKIKWGPFFGAQSKVLSYAVAIDSGGDGLVVFNGNSSFDGVDQPIIGVSEVRFETPTKSELVIVVQPRNLALSVGDELLLQVNAEGSEPMAYQWFFNDGEIPDATSPSFGLTDVSRENSGSYSVEVSNSTGVVRSKPTNVYVLESV